MRVLLSTIGSRGDVQPLVALALELKRQGHDVHLCVPPDFSEWTDSFRLPVTTIGPRLRGITGSGGTRTVPTPEQRRQLAEATVAAQFQTMTAAAAGCDAIVGATALQIAARSVAETRGVPYVFAAYAPNVIPSQRHPPPPLPAFPGMPAPAPDADYGELWRRDAERFNDLFGAALNAHRASIGLAAVADARSHVFTGQPWLAADPVLAPWPDADDPAVLQTGAWLLADDRALPGELETFLGSGDPPIYFGFGSMRASPDVGRVLVDAARAVGRRAIVARGWADLALPDVQPDCISVDEVNQQALFTRVAAVVHHGGAGTTTTAARAGVPQVIVPQLYDQHYFASRVEQLGIGAAHPAGAPQLTVLVTALERALQPDVAAHAGAVARAVRTDGAAVAAARLFELVQSRSI